MSVGKGEQDQLRWRWGSWPREVRAAVRRKMDDLVQRSGPGSHLYGDIAAAKDEEGPEDRRIWGFPVGRHGREKRLVWASGWTKEEALQEGLGIQMNFEQTVLRGEQDVLEHYYGGTTVVEVERAIGQIGGELVTRIPRVEMLWTAYLTGESQELREDRLKSIPLGIAEEREAFARGELWEIDFEDPCSVVVVSDDRGLRRRIVENVELGIVAQERVVEGAVVGQSSSQLGVNLLDLTAERELMLAGLELAEEEMYETQRERDGTWPTQSVAVVNGWGKWLELIDGGEERALVCMANIAQDLTAGCRGVVPVVLMGAEEYDRLEARWEEEAVSLWLSQAEIVWGADQVDWAPPGSVVRGGDNACFWVLR